MIRTKCKVSPEQRKLFNDRPTASTENYLKTSGITYGELE